MTPPELQTFIEKSLQGRWPDWKPTDAELRDWRGVLVKFDYLKSVQLLQDFILNADHPGKRPNIARIRKALAQATLWSEKVEDDRPAYIPATKEQKWKALVDCAGAGREYCKNRLREKLKWPTPDDEMRWRIITACASAGNAFAEELLTEQVSKEARKADITEQLVDPVNMTESQRGAMDFAQRYGL